MVKERLQVIFIVILVAIFLQVVVQVIIFSFVFLLFHAGTRKVGGEGLPVNSYLAGGLQLAREHFAKHAVMLRRCQPA